MDLAPSKLPKGDIGDQHFAAKKETHKKSNLCNRSFEEKCNVADAKSFSVRYSALRRHSDDYICYRSTDYKPESVILIVFRTHSFCM